MSTIKVVEVDERYNHIGIDWSQVNDLNELEQWCNEHGYFEVYATGVVYKRTEDLTMFLLKWT